MWGDGPEGEKDAPKNGGVSPAPLTTPNKEGE
jgi:hypothetical protein